MNQYGGTKYPLLAESKGPIEPYAVSVVLKTVTGVYLNYLIEANYKYNKCVYLVFDMALAPYAVEVETVDGENFKSWTLSNLDTKEFETFARESGVKVAPETSIDELAREVLVRVNDRESVMVPGYRYQGKYQA